MQIKSIETTIEVTILNQYDRSNYNILEIMSKHTF